MTCLARVGRARATVLRAVVCGPCWAAHGGSPAAGEIGPTPTQPVTSCDPADQGHWLRALRRQPWVQAVRVDGQRNLLTLARLLALYAQWDTLESRPTWAKLIGRSGLSERTVARWLQELRVRGWLAHLEHGSTPTTRPMALAHLEGNRAALYGLRVPLTPDEALARAGEQLVTALGTMLDNVTEDTAAAPTAPETAGEQGESRASGEKNGSPPWSFQVCNQRIVGGSSRASTPVDNSPTIAADPAAIQRTALRADSDRERLPDLSIMVPISGFEMLAAADWLRTRLPVFGRCSRKLVRHLCQPYWRAGWCNRDIAHALDHRPSVFDQPTGLLLSPDHVAAPAQFIRSRLRAWRTPDETIITGYWAARVADANEAKAAPKHVAARHGRAGAALLRAGERALTAERIAEHGRAARQRGESPSAAASANPAEHALERRERDRALLVARARAELARPNGTSTPIPTPANPALAQRNDTCHRGHTVYERAVARAHTEHGTGRRVRRNNQR